MNPKVPLRRLSSFMAKAKCLVSWALTRVHQCYWINFLLKKKDCKVLMLRMMFDHFGRAKILPPFLLFLSKGCISHQSSDQPQGFTLALKLSPPQLGADQRDAKTRCHPPSVYFSSLFQWRVLHNGDWDNTVPSAFWCQTTHSTRNRISTNAICLQGRWRSSSAHPSPTACLLRSVQYLSS